MAIPVQRHVGHITCQSQTRKSWELVTQHNISAISRLKRLSSISMISQIHWYGQQEELINKQHPVINSFKYPTFPAPEQFEHLSVLGGDRGWSPPSMVDTASASTRVPVLEHRAQARYPTKIYSKLASPTYNYTHKIISRVRTRVEYWTENVNTWVWVCVGIWVNKELNPTLTWLRIETKEGFKHL